MSDHHPLFSGIGGHHQTKGKSDSWITPQPVIAALGGFASFNLDPCASTPQPWPCARHAFSMADNGLLQSWAGRVWLNPPYSAPAPWLARLGAHGQGTALIFARTETDAFARWVWAVASGILFLRGRLCFHRPDGSLPQRKSASGGPANSGAPSVLIAYGTDDLDRLAFCGLPGQFLALRFSRGLLVAALTRTWRQEVAALLGASDGPVRLDDLYRAMADHPKARANPNYRAKIRQVLQQGGFRRVDRGVWAAA